MGHSPNWSPGQPSPISTGPEGVRFQGDSPRQSTVQDSLSDLAELFAKFEKNSGGTLSPQFSADLALDIVLNEIVEQACLATGASAAAVVLWRGTEFVCRATNGTSAPVLGAQMDARSGLSGLCIQSGQVQRCDDTHTDPRADREASQSLGVRSVMVLPLARFNGIVGILEVMSERPAAFGERDQRTLEVLAARVLRNVERAADPFLLRAKSIAATPLPLLSGEQRVVEKITIAPSTQRQPVFDAPLSGPIFSAPAAVIKRPGIDFVTWLMGSVLLAAAVLLGLLTGRRFGWNFTAFRTQSARASAQPASTKMDSKASQTGASSAVTNTPSAGDQSDSSANPVAKTPPFSAVSDGELRVFENGREVFRLPATPRNIPGSQRKNEAVNLGVAKDGVAKNDASKNDDRLTPARLVELPPDAAEGSVIHRVEPEYPESARARKVQGKVVLKIRIQPDGAVDDVQLVSGDPLLAQAAINAVMQWKFKPETSNGELAETQTQVILNFRLPQ
jgi:TonB family protein